VKKHRKWKKKDDVCREFGLLYSTIQQIYNSTSNIISALEGNGSRNKASSKAWTECCRREAA